MTLFKREGSPYYQYDFLFNGRRHWGSTKLRNKKAAGRFQSNLVEKLAKARGGIVDPEPAPLLRDFAKRFLEMVRPELRPNTWRGYCVSLGLRMGDDGKLKERERGLLDWFGGKGLDEITPAMVAEFKEARLREGRSGATVNRDLHALRRIFSVALKNDVVSSTPFAARRIEFCREQSRERVLSFEEERKYLAAASPLLRDVATIILETGLRPGEVFNLRIQDAHLFAATPFVRVPMGKTPSAARDVALTPKVLAVLERRRAAAKGPFVFPSRVGNGHDWARPMNELEPAHQRAIRASGVAPFRLYDLRHAFASRAVESGMDTLTLKAIMGHADLKTTSRYVHPTFRHLAEAQKRLQTFRAEREIAEAEARVGSSTLAN